MSLKKFKELMEFPSLNAIGPRITIFLKFAKKLLKHKTYKLIPELSYTPIKNDIDLIALEIDLSFFGKIGFGIILIARNRNTRKSEVIGFIEIKTLHFKMNTNLSLNLFSISFSGIKNDYIGYGIAEKVYKYVAVKYKTLASDTTISRGALKLWSRILNENDSRFSFFIITQAPYKGVFDYIFDLNKNDILPWGESFFTTEGAQIVMVRKNTIEEAFLKKMRDLSHEKEDWEYEIQKRIEDKTKEKYLKQKSFKKMKKL